jgi:MerR family transcriptional regulator/heat shock protein HspR
VTTSSSTKRTSGTGGGPNGATPSARSWRERIRDPAEPLYTIAVAADLLGVDPQSLRRLSKAIDQGEARSSGNQRRYSRHDLERLDDALQLAADGHNSQSIATILELTQQVAATRGR